MPILIPKLGLQIYTSPKVLSTSLKHLAFEIENGFSFEPYEVNGQRVHIHKLSPVLRFAPPDLNSCPRVVVFLRDPVDRFISLYRDRVLLRRKRSQQQWRHLWLRGLSHRPTLKEFLDNLPAYRQSVPEVRHHSKAQVDFVGDNAGLFERIFSPGSVEHFEQFVSELSGHRVKLPHRHVSSVPFKDVVTDEIGQQIRDIYLEDYCLLTKLKNRVMATEIPNDLNKT